jgi:hypothetical protein
MFKRYAQEDDVQLLAAGATVEDLTVTADQGQAYYAGVAA